MCVCVCLCMVQGTTCYCLIHSQCAGLEPGLAIMHLQLQGEKNQIFCRQQLPWRIIEARPLLTLAFLYYCHGSRVD